MQHTLYDEELHLQHADRILPGGVRLPGRQPPGAGAAAHAAGAPAGAGQPPAPPARPLPGPHTAHAGLRSRLAGRRSHPDPSALQKTGHRGMRPPCTQGSSVPCSAVCTFSPPVTSCILQALLGRAYFESTSQCKPPVTQTHARILPVHTMHEPAELASKGCRLAIVWATALSPSALRWRLSQHASCRRCRPSEKTTTSSSLATPHILRSCAPQPCTPCSASRLARLQLQLQGVRCHAVHANALECRAAGHASFLGSEAANLQCRRSISA